MLRVLWRWAWRCLAALLVLAVALVAAFRHVDPPATAFMLGAQVNAWRAGEALTIQQQWIAPLCLANSSRLAVIAAEDQKFASHNGFDVEQIAGALAEARQGGRVRGASTLSQQTVKNLFLWPGQSWVRKGLEAGLTVLVETLWPKQRILETYLNVAEFGSGVYGVEAAARRYFGKAAVELGDAESALLAAVLPNPRVLRVDAPSDYVRERQRWILAHMPKVRVLPGVAPLLQPATGRCDANAL